MKLSVLKNSLEFAEDGLQHFQKCWSFLVKKVYFFYYQFEATVK